MKKAFSLFEIILVLFISSIILIYTFNFAQKTQESQVENETIAILKIDLNSTKIIIERNLPTASQRLKYIDSTLYLDEYILLKNVSSFSKQTSSNILTIDITLDNKISQTWKFRL